MGRIPKSRLEQVLTAFVIALALTGLAVLIPTAAQRLGALRPMPTQGTYRNSTMAASSALGLPMALALLP